MKTKVGLIGFGKAGKAVASVILQNKTYSLEWVLRRKKILEHRNIPEFLGIESDEPGLIYSNSTIAVTDLLKIHPVDVIIDFSSDSAIYTYGQTAARQKIKIISAISHYEEKEREYLKKLSEDTVVFWSPNITLGVNYLIFAAKLLKKIAPWVDIEIIEEHFKGKVGVSGTAVKLAKELNIEQSEINSIRAGGIVSKHEIIFGFPYQTVRLIHESISREAYGNGILFVADHLTDKSIGFYTFEDIFSPYFQNK
jgi:Dihydrodipicolinate reductase